MTIFVLIDSVRVSHKWFGAAIKLHLKQYMRLMALHLTLILLLPVVSWAGRPTLILVDMQKRYLPKNSEPKDRLVHEQIGLLEWAKKNNIGVIVVEYSFMGATIEELRQKLAEFPPDRVEFVPKHTDGAFDHPVSEAKILEILDGWQSDRLIVCGINASYCVHDTTEGALKRGYEVFSANDVLGDFARVVHRHPAPLVIDSEIAAGLTVFPTRVELQACQELLVDRAFDGPRLNGERRPRRSLLERLDYLIDTVRGRIAGEY